MMDVTAESLSVVHGELVFVTSGVTVKVIAADTYNEAELVDPTSD